MLKLEHLSMPAALEERDPSVTKQQSLEIQSEILSRIRLALH